MGKATVIPQNAFEALQVEAGVLLTSFDPTSPVIADDAIVCATTGGITVTAKPTYSDYFEDVDNAPDNVMEGKRLDGWECSLSTTGLGTSPALIKLALGAADIDSENTSKIIPRRDLELTDFTSSIWWVGDRADGGLVACQLLNALSTDGFSLKTTKKGKGQTGLTLMGHVSINAQDVVPMVFYSIDPEETEVLTIKLNKSGIMIADGDTETLTAKTDAEASVTWASTDTTVATVVNGVVTAESEGVCVITAKASKNGEVAIDSCNVTVTAAGEG